VKFYVEVELNGQDSISEKQRAERLAAADITDTPRALG
jgi:hypothetical protein